MRLLLRKLLSLCNGAQTVLRAAPAQDTLGLVGACKEDEEVYRCEAVVDDFALACARKLIDHF